MGKMIDAQSIVVSATATGVHRQEGAILRRVFPHSLALADPHGPARLAPIGPAVLDGAVNVPSSFGLEAEHESRPRPRRQPWHNSRPAWSPCVWHCCPCSTCDRCHRPTRPRIDRGTSQATGRCRDRGAIGGQIDRVRLSRDFGIADSPQPHTPRTALRRLAPKPAPRRRVPRGGPSIPGTRAARRYGPPHSPGRSRSDRSRRRRSISAGPARPLPLRADIRPIACPRRLRAAAIAATVGSSPLESHSRTSGPTVMSKAPC